MLGLVPLVGQKAQGECSGRYHQHEGWRTKAFEIADPQVRDSCSYKIDYEASARRNSQPWKFDPGQQAQCAGKLASGQKWEKV